MQDFVRFSDSLNIACGRIADLKALTGEFSDAQFHAIFEPTLEKRRRERATVYHLLNAIAPYASLIRYTPSGQPLLYPDCQLHMSVSHSDNYVAVATAKFPVGIDIETITDRITRLAPKFLSQSETDQLDFLFHLQNKKERTHEGNEDNPASEEIEKKEDSGYREQALLTAFWTAKEAIFKAAGVDGLVISQIHLTCIPSDKKTSIAYPKTEFPRKDASLTLYANVGTDRYAAICTVIDEGRTCLCIACREKNTEKIGKNFFCIPL